MNDGESYVYFIRDPRSGLIKVGYSANPVMRKYQLECQVGGPLELLGMLPGGRSVEQSYHRAMAAFRDHGEWFRPNSLIAAYLEHAGTVRERQEHDIRLEDAWDGWGRYLQSWDATQHLEKHPGEIIALLDIFPAFDNGGYWREWSELLS